MQLELKRGAIVYLKRGGVICGPTFPDFSTDAAVNPNDFSGHFYYFFLFLFFARVIRANCGPPPFKKNAHAINTGGMKRSPDFKSLFLLLKLFSRPSALSFNFSPDLIYAAVVDCRQGKKRGGNDFVSSSFSPMSLSFSPGWGESGTEEESIDDDDDSRRGEGKKKTRSLR